MDVSNYLAFESITDQRRERFVFFAMEVSTIHFWCTRMYLFICKKSLEISLNHLSRTSFMSVDIVSSSLTISRAALTFGGLFNLFRAAHIPAGLVLALLSRSLYSFRRCSRLKYLYFLSNTFWALLNPLDSGFQLLRGGRGLKRYKKYPSIYPEDTKPQRY